MATLKEEERQLRKLIGGLTVARVRFRRRNELMIEFSDGMRLFVDGRGNGVLELSVT